MTVSAAAPQQIGSALGVTTQEAAWLTELSAKLINRTIDRGELTRVAARRPLGRDRRLVASDVVYLALRRELSELLSQQARAELYHQLELNSEIYFQLLQSNGKGPDLEALTPDQVSSLRVSLAGGTIRIELRDTIRRLARRWWALRDASQHVVSDPEIRGGEPVIRNTRVPVYLIADLRQQGASVKEILHDYPSLDTSMVRSAIAYADTHPKRGRRRSAPWKE